MSKAQHVSIQFEGRDIQELVGKIIQFLSMVKGINFAQPQQAGEGTPDDKPGEN
jgi:hypothetical protein